MMKQWLPVLSRYSVIGIASVIANNVILICGDMMGLHYAVSTLLCFFLVGGIAYFAHANITFGAPHSISGYFRYCLAQSLGLILTLALIAAMIDGLHWPIWIAAPVVSVAMLIYTFVATRWAVMVGHGAAG